MIDKIILNYKIVGSIGSGGMADVYLAEHTLIGKKVAIKHLFPQLAKNPAIVKRFVGEAKKMARIQGSLNHPNIVQVQNYHQDQDGLFIIMEYVPGQDLSQYIDKLGAPLDRSEAKKIMLQILDAFITIHEAGIIHKDIKPSNILITPSKKIKIVDFGISEIVGEDDFHKTKSQAIGTIPYMSPEQVKNEDIGIHSDIYSIGMVYYEMLMGSSPYKMLSSPYEISNRIVNRPLHSLVDTLGDQYHWEWRIIEKATRKKKSLRFQNCQEFKSMFNNTDVDNDIIFGCTDPSAINFDPKATVNNGTCKYAEPPTPPEPKERRKWWVWLLGALGATMLVFLVYKLLNKPPIDATDEVTTISKIDPKKEADSLVNIGKFEDALKIVNKNPEIEETYPEFVDNLKKVINIQ